MSARETIRDTIYALASAPGRGGVAVIRVSGDKAWDSLRILGGKFSQLKPRYAAVSKLYDPVSRETIDHALVLPFQSPQSFTGEDVLEYHLHGGPAIIRKIYTIFEAQEGYRLAEPGEFTRRAFENGKLDLTQAEAIADLVDAETEYQRIQAISQSEGALAKLYDDWRQACVHILAHLEAHLDFPDEEDVPDTLPEEVRQAIVALGVNIQTHLDDNNRGERLREGIRIAIIGPPNAGKSSLLNTLAKRDVAIVSDVAGTTRDVLEVKLDIGGYPVILIDTAGLRPDQIDESDAQSRIEGEGIKRALTQAKEADIRLLMFNAQDLPDLDPATLALMDERSILVLNKMDAAKKDNLQKLDLIPLSIKDGYGLEALIEKLQIRVEDVFGYQKQPSLTRERHRGHLRRCLIALNEAQDEPTLELSAEHLRSAAQEIGAITGKIDVEQLLDVIFRDFCIGK